MNKSIISTFGILGLTLLVACSPKEETDSNSALQTLEHTRDSLRIEAQKLSTQIHDVENNITAKREALGISKTFAVKTVKLERDTFQHFIKVQGNVSADKSITLNAESSGAIRSIFITEGATVSAGQALISLDTDIQNNRLTELETSYNLASVVFQKQEKLWKQNIGSEIEYLRAKNEKEALETRIQTLKTEKSKSTIRAPFSGTVDLIMPKVGESVAPGTPMVRLVNNKNVKIESEISERYVGRIKKGSKLLITTPRSTKPIELTIDYSGNFINPANRTFKVWSKLDNKNGDLLPNMVTDMAIRDYINTDAVIVPNKAILEDLSGGYYVYVVKINGDLKKVEKKNVELGKNYEGTTEITKGLNGDEVLIIEGAKSVNPGDVVSLMK